MNELDLLESAWGLIANAYGGDWDLASEASGWKKAAERWRDEYHKVIKIHTKMCNDWTKRWEEEL